MPYTKSKVLIMWDDISTLSETEIRVILRAADEIIPNGGRTLLANILKDSRDKKVLQLGFDKSPAYGKTYDKFQKEAKKND